HWNRYRPCTAPVQHDQIEYIFCTNIGQFAFCLRCGNDASTNARAVAKVADWRRFLWECCGQVARLCARMRLVFGPEYAMVLRNGWHIKCLAKIGRWWPGTLVRAGRLGSRPLDNS